MEGEERENENWMRMKIDEAANDLHLDSARPAEWFKIMQEVSLDKNQ